MAYATTPERGDSAFGRKLGSASRESRDNRAREFGRAKRHSARVRALKIILPLAAAGIVSLYALPAFLSISIDDGRGKATVRAITLEAGSLKMLEPRIKGVNEKQDAYDFIADSATQASKDADVMYLDKIRGKVTGQDGKVTTLNAPNGVHNNKADEMTFNNGVVVKREPDMTATLQTATAFMKQQTVISKTPVIVRLRESTIHSDSMTLYWGEQRAIFEGNVRTHIERQPAEAGSPSQPGTQPPAAGTGSTGSDPAR
jgi:lipopolysaccharide export system protein LptC